MKIHESSTQNIYNKCQQFTSFMVACFRVREKIESLKQVFLLKWILWHVSEGAKMLTSHPSRFYIINIEWCGICMCACVSPQAREFIERSALNIGYLYNRHPRLARVFYSLSNKGTPMWQTLLFHTIIIQMHRLMRNTRDVNITYNGTKTTRRGG